MIVLGLRVKTGWAAALLLTGPSHPSFRLAASTRNVFSPAKTVSQHAREGHP
jgi:hypothetical protein